MRFGQLELIDRGSSTSHPAAPLLDPRVGPWAFHARNARGRTGWACEHPEFPGTADLWYEVRCRNCALALGAIASHEPERPMDNPAVRVTMSALDAYESIRSEHELPALR